MLIKNNMNKRGAMALSQIFILIIGIFAVAYAFGSGMGEVSGAVGDKYRLRTIENGKPFYYLGLFKEISPKKCKKYKEFEEGRKEIEDDYKNQKKELYYKYASSNNPYKIGDIIKDHYHIIRIKKIMYTILYNKPSCV